MGSKTGSVTALLFGSCPQSSQKIELVHAFGRLDFFFFCRKMTLTVGERTNPRRSHHSLQQQPVRVGPVALNCHLAAVKGKRVLVVENVVKTRPGRGRGQKDCIQFQAFPFRTTTLQSGKGGGGKNTLPNPSFQKQTHACRKTCHAI
jgi:hypothetical protein